MLAMKLLAARNVDRQDIATLVDHLELRRPEEATRIYQELFPDEKLKNEGQELLDWAFRRER
jgi:hypothetical protein